MDTLAYAKHLRAAGFDERQAEALAEGLRDAARNELATKGDIFALRSEVKEVEMRLVKWMVGLTVPIYALLVGVLLSLP